MATRPKIFNSRPALLTCILFFTFLLVIVWPGHATAVSPADLTAKGHQLMANDQPQAALQTWRQALEQYKAQRNPEGINGSLLNMSNAEQALNRPDLACQTLYKAIQTTVNINLCQPTTQQAEVTVLPAKLKDLPLARSILENLGQVYLQTGQLELGQVLLASLHQRYPQADGVTLNLANSYESQVRRAIARSQVNQDPQTRLEETVSVQKSTVVALQYYRQLSASTDPWIRAQAQLNELGLHTQISTWAERPPEISPDLARLQQLIEICNQPSQGLTPHQSWQQRFQLTSLLADLNSPKWNKTAQLMAEDLHSQAQNQHSSKRIAQSGLVLSQIFLQSNQLAPVESTLTLSLERAKQLGDPGLVFAAQWALAQFYERQGNYGQQLGCLQAAVTVANQMGSSYLWASTHNKNGFNTAVEPVYRKLFTRLLESSKPDIPGSLEVFENLRQSQLETYLGCGRLGLQSISSIFSRQRQTENPSLVYLISSGKQLNVVFQDPKGVYSLHRAPMVEVKSHLDTLLLNLQADSARTVPESIILRDAAPLYTLLIQPFASKIPSQGSLVFIVDTELQGLPLGVLHNGKNYLNVDHPISLSTPQSRQPRLMTSNQMKVLIAGIDQDAPAFKPNGLNSLPGVAEEIRAVRDIFRNNITLQNTGFNASALKQSAQRGYPVMHIATHGVFTGDPDKTVLFAWDKPISVRQVQEVFQTAARTASESNLELLVLTGCELARGDWEAGLGLAGIGIQAGARSTLASLWKVDDTATTQFVQAFYKAVITGKTKTEALQFAQQDLRASTKFSHPYYWGGWVLLGSWL
jgi:CHAT domain-containing protein